ncbi:DUF6957 family protein [Pseudomonas baetica]|uniref:DUF6957 family protein n=1 Tax=Pseudomonas baetica TaxID=674054 RepID=UPI0035B4FB92
MLGHNASDEEAIALAQRRFGHAPYCLVRQWIWIDLVMPPSLLEALERDARLPVMIYAHEVVMDSQGRLKPGDCVNRQYFLGCQQHLEGRRQRFGQ